MKCRLTFGAFYAVVSCCPFGKPRKSQVCNDMMSVQYDKDSAEKEGVTPMAGTTINLYDDLCHYDVIKWKHFPRYWPFVRGIYWSPVISPHKCQWRGALMFSLICVWINGWVNSREAGNLRRYRAHFDVIVMALQEGRNLQQDFNQNNQPFSIEEWNSWVL